MRFDLEKRRYYNEMALYALDVLHIASLVPYTRRAIVGATVNNRSGMAILLSAAGGHAFLSEPEVRELCFSATS